MKHDRTVAEFFAGIGLMRMGLERDGWRVVWANDIDADKREMYEGHFRNGHAHFHLGDVHAVPADSIPPISLATASFPCTDLSLAGARRGLAGRESSAFWGFINVITGMKSHRPPLVMIENVSGFLSSHGGKDFRDACLALNALGYSVDVILIDAACFVPQSRSRLFLFGRLEDAGFVVARETPTFYQDHCRPKAVADFILCHPEIRWSLRNLPPLPERTMALSDILEDLPPSSACWWTKERAEYLLNQMSEKHRRLAETMIAGRKASFGTVFRRVRGGRSMAELRTDGIAGCLRTPRGGSGRQILFVAGGGKYAARLLTPRECARLMGADDYRICASSNQALFGFGDAVCVPVITWIAKNYLTPVWKEIHEVKKRKELYGRRAV